MAIDRKTSIKTAFSLRKSSQSQESRLTISALFHFVAPGDIIEVRPNDRRKGTAQVRVAKEVAAAVPPSLPPFAMNTISINKQTRAPARAGAHPPRAADQSLPGD